MVKVDGHYLIVGDGLEVARAQIRRNLARLDSTAEAGFGGAAREDAGEELHALQEGKKAFRQNLPITAAETKFKTEKERQAFRQGWKGEESDTRGDVVTYKTTEEYAKSEMVKKAERVLKDPGASAAEKEKAKGYLASRRGDAEPKTKSGKVLTEGRTYRIGYGEFKGKSGQLLEMTSSGFVLLKVAGKEVQLHSTDLE